MLIIEIAALDNGAHRNQNGSLSRIPDGWAVVPVEQNTLENFPFGSFETEEINGRVYMKADSWFPAEIPEPETDISAQISELKAQLESTDYKIIKCSEAQLIGEELPYDIMALHAERQALRDKINELEGSVE